MQLTSQFNEFERVRILKEEMEPKAVNWDLKRTEAELFFCLNGKRMVDEKNQELRLEQIGHGRSAGEVWMKFKDAKVGKNFSLKGLDPSSKFFKSSGSVTDIIDAVSKQCPWVSVYRRNLKKKVDSVTTAVNSKRAKIAAVNDENVQCKPVELPEIRFIENFIGKFEVNILTLQEPPPEYTTRRLNGVWVQTIKDKIMRDPSLISTVIPVLIDPNQVKDKEDFVPGNLSSYNLWSIGGNHLRSALQEIARETSLSRSRLVHIHLYCGLSNSDALEVGNRHNGSQLILKPTFQDCVMQSVQFRDNPDIADKVARMMSDLEMKEIPKESVGTIVSVTKYSQENFELVKKLFSTHEMKNSPVKSIPQTLFRELQGIQDEKRTGFLQQAVNNGLTETVKNVKKAKKINKLEACFMSIVGCNDMDLCSELYPDHVSQIEKFTELNMPKDTVPQAFVEFCQEAKIERTKMIKFKPIVNVDILYDGKNIAKLKSMSNYVNKIKLQINKYILNHELQILNDMEITEKGDIVNDSNDSGMDLSVTVCESGDYSVIESECSVSSEDRETQPPLSQMDLFQDN